MPCTKCGVSGNLFSILEQCMDGDCTKKYCSRCATKFLIECEDCESCYCEEHFEDHECENEDEDEEDEVVQDLTDYITYSLSKKKATILRHNLSARQEMELIEKLEDEGYVESARDEQVLLFSKKNKGEEKNV